MIRNSVIALVASLVILALGGAADVAADCDGPVFGVWDDGSEYGPTFTYDLHWCWAADAEDYECINDTEWFYIDTYNGEANYCDANLPYRWDWGIVTRYMLYRITPSESSSPSGSSSWTAPSFPAGSFTYHSYPGGDADSGIYLNATDATAEVHLCDSGPTTCVASNPIDDPSEYLSGPEYLIGGDQYGPPTPYYENIDNLLGYDRAWVLGPDDS